MVCLGLKPGGRMEGKDESTELWRHPNLCQCCVIVVLLTTSASLKSWEFQDVGPCLGFQ